MKKIIFQKNLSLQLFEARDVITDLSPVDRVGHVMVECALVKRPIGVPR